MGHDALIDTLPLYAAGVLDREDRQEIDAHLLSGCPTCHMELKEFQAVASLLPYSLPPVSPPRTLKGKILVACTPPSPVPEIHKRPNQPSLEPGDWMKHLFPPTPRFPNWATSVIAVLGAIFAASFLYMGYAAYVRTVREAPVAESLRDQMQQAQSRIADLEAQLHERDAMLAQVRSAVESHDGATNDMREALILREAEIEDLRNQLAQLDKDSLALRRARAQSEEIAGLFRSPSVRVSSLEGSESVRAAAGLLLYDQSAGKAFFYAYNLPAPPPGMNYQLWAIDVKPINLGIVRVDSGRKGRLPIKGLSPSSRISKFAVTLEPERTQPLPTGPIVLSGVL